MSQTKPGLHPRNRFRTRYDFPRLIACSPALAAFVAPNAHGDLSIDHADPAAVKALNGALLQDAYSLKAWDIPPGHLCPPVPGRSDYLHYLADLLAADAGTPAPQGPSIRVLDIGTGASCIYPLIGASEHGWRFVGTDIEPAVLRWARKLADANPSVAGLIELRLQASALECFRGVIEPGEVFDASICNPPFHASAAEAEEGTHRKLRNLSGTKSPAMVRNFGGTAGELWCSGGEPGFVQRMMTQSAELPQACLWFTTLVSKSEHLPRLQRALKAARALEVKTIEMIQGQKRSRILAWTFMSPGERRSLRQGR